LACLFSEAVWSKNLPLYRPAVPAGPGWQPKELGLPKATALSVLLVAAIVGFLLFAGENFLPKPQPPMIQVTQAQLVTLPTPTPPPPPKVIPPKPLPALIPKPIPVPSKIVVATKPPPPVHHFEKPIPHPIETHTPPPPTPQTTPAPPQAAPPTSGLPIYGSQMHAILQANQDVPQALKTLGLSGTAYVEIVVSPAGHAISAKIYRSSGNPLIDQTCLDHALHADYGAFNAQMPDSNQAFIIPIEIQAENDN
jgi:protein TonB